MSADRIGILLPAGSSVQYVVACEEHTEIAVRSLMHNGIEPTGEVITVKDPCPVCLYAAEHGEDKIPTAPDGTNVVRAKRL